MMYHSGIFLYKKPFSFYEMQAIKPQNYEIRRIFYANTFCSYFNLCRINWTYEIPRPYGLGILIHEKGESALNYGDFLHMISQWPWAY